MVDLIVFSQLKASLEALLDVDASVSIFFLISISVSYLVVQRVSLLFPRPADI